MSKPTLPPQDDGPFYACSYALAGRGWCPQCDGTKSRMHQPGKLRWIDGVWICRWCWLGKPAKDWASRRECVWDEAMTLAEFLADDPGRWRNRTAQLLEILRDDETRVASDFWNRVQLIEDELRDA